MCPAAFDRKPSSDLRRGDTHIAPPFDQNIPSNRVGGGVPDALR